MILKWTQVYVEDRKLKSQLITYSSDENDNQIQHIQALASALERMENKKTHRIIIERGEKK